MSEVLFLAHRMPFQPDRGDKIRSFHVLKSIAARAPVHVACFADDEADMGHAGELAALAASHCLVRRTRSTPVAALAALATGKPVSLTAFAAPAIAAYVARVLQDRPILAIYVFSGQMAQYVPIGFAGRVVMDFVDVDSAKFDAYASSGSRLARPMYRREARLLRRFEERTALRATTSLLVTAEERELFEARLSGSARPHVRAMGNGIDTAFFDPAGVAAAPEMQGAGPQITFAGQMDYPPNIAAVQMFAGEVMPRIREAYPQAVFNVVGRAPTAAVRALHGRNGVRVTGAVPDIRPWLAGAGLVVAPLQIARGVQNKVLEAMAMARPVVLSRAAATGIPARDGAEFAIADGARELAEAAVALLGDAPRATAMGEAARAFVQRACSWDQVLSPLPQFLGLTPEEPRLVA